MFFVSACPNVFGILVKKLRYTSGTTFVDDAYDTANTLLVNNFEIFNVLLVRKAGACPTVLKSSFCSKCVLFIY